MVKGIGFIGVFKFIKLQPDSAELLEKVLSSLSPESEKICRKKFIAVREYPYQVFVDLLRTFDRVLGVGDLSLCRDVGEFAADLDYKFFFGDQPGKLKPEDLFRDSGVYWKSYYVNSGEMVALETAPARSIVRIIDFPQMDPAHCRLIEGWIAKSMANAGAVLLEYGETLCTSRGDPYHEYMGVWKHNDAKAPARTSPEITLPKHDKS